MMGLWNKLARPQERNAPFRLIRAGAAAGQLDFFCAANHAIEPRVGLGETGCGCVAARPLRPPIRMSSYAVRPGNRRVRLEDKVRRRPLREYRNRSQANWSAVITVDRLPSSATLTTCSGHCTRRVGHRGAKDRCALPPLQWAANASNAMALQTQLARVRLSQSVRETSPHA